MANLTIGSRADHLDSSAELTATRLNRHTFWCGQSGSGKTYALGVLLEQVLINTSLPIVVFDPNADFVRMNELTGDGPDAATLASRDIRVLRPGGDTPLRVRFRSLSLPAKAALLRIDPLADRDEYNALLHANEVLVLPSPDGVQEQLRRSPDPVHHALALRIDNLRLTEWGIWAFEKPAATEIIAERPDATILDLGGFEHSEEPLAVALSVLEDLWNKREDRRPVLLVIDEAHNLAAPDLDSPIARAVRDLLIRIAAEGRKFGLWLVLSTQRPSRIHPSILSQCDNLALMRMSSPLDLDELAKVFGFAPADFMAQSPHFRQGQALFAGGFIETPDLVQMGARLTAEGGKDVPVPLR